MNAHRDDCGADVGGGPKSLPVKRIVAALVVVVMAVSANIAWLNPVPGMHPRCVLSPVERIPIFWQYSTDTQNELDTAINFPAYDRFPTRTNRPVYHACAHYVGLALWLLAAPFADISIATLTALAFVLLNAGLCYLYGMATYALLRSRIGQRGALLAVALTLMHAHAILYAGTYHTGLFQFVTPAIVLYLFVSLARNYSLARNIAFSVFVGLLLLAKENYAVYLCVLLVALAHGRVIACIVSGIAHLVPLGLWIFALRLMGLEYYNHEVEACGQGAWVFTEFLHMPVGEMASTVGRSLALFVICLTDYYGVWLLLAIAGVAWMGVRTRLLRRYWILGVAFLLAAWAQMFGANRHQPYMTSDMAPVVYGAAAWCCVRLSRRFGRYGTCALVVCVVLWFAYNLVSLANFSPWISPFEQLNFTR